MYVFWLSVVLAAFWNWNLSPIWFCMALGLESTHSHVSFPFWAHFLELELNAADSKVFATLWSLNVSFSMIGLKLISGSFPVY